MKPESVRTLRAAILGIAAIVLGAPVQSSARADEGPERPWAIRGSIVTESGARDGWVVFDRTGIRDVTAATDGVPKDARRIEYDGFIFPNLIDTHDHAQWNVIPQWRAPGGRKFESRYAWLFLPEYVRDVNDPYRNNIASKPELLHAALKYAEIRALVGATTLIQTTYRAPEPAYLARNLDSTYGADSRIQDITAITQAEIDRFRKGFADGTTRRLFLHIGEGKRYEPEATGMRAGTRTKSKSGNEFAFLEKIGLVRPGVVVIHGVALDRCDFRRMAEAGMYLVWSPKSNEVLYGATAAIQEALDEGLTVAVAPDWTITGSDNTLEEMKVAYEYSKSALKGAITPRQIFKMATSDAAKVAGVEERLGRVGVGFAADVFLAPKKDVDPFVSLLRTLPQDIHLLFINGSPIYGDPGELGKWVDKASLDVIDVEQTKKAILLGEDPHLENPPKAEHYDDLVKRLRAALPALAPLVEPNN